MLRSHRHDATLEVTSLGAATVPSGGPFDRYLLMTYAQSAVLIRSLNPQSENKFCQRWVRKREEIGFGLKSVPAPHDP
jgi:hypothetical protein